MIWNRWARNEVQPLLLPVEMRKGNTMAELYEKHWCMFCEYQKCQKEELRQLKFLGDELICFLCLSCCFRNPRRAKVTIAMNDSPMVLL